MLALGLWFGLVTGVGDVLLTLIAADVLHRYMHLSPQVIWIAPLSSGFLFALPGLVFFVLARWLPRRHWLFPSAAVFAFLMAWALARYLTRVHPLAALLLSLGIAVQAARVVTAHPAGMRRLVRYTLPAMVVLVALAGLGFNGWAALSERRAVAGLPRAYEGASNVLLIILDTVRASDLSLYGYARRTSPALERFARRGVVFDRAYAAAPWTLPSHGSLFTGRWPHELNANWRVPLDATHPMLAEVLTQRGYETAGFVANKFYASRESGLARGFQHYEDFRLSVGAILLGSSLGRYLTGRTRLPRLLGHYEEIGRKPASRVSADALAWLARRGADDRPFFIFINYYDAHDPYLPPAPFDTLFDRRRIPVNIPIVMDRPVTPRYAIGDVAAYDETLAALDHQLGLLLDELDRRGALLNTLVVIAADHGEEFGEHGLMKHGNSLYAQALHVPLVVAFPGRVPAGRRFPEPVSLRDVAATVLDLTGPVDGGHGSPSVLPGLSLARFWNGDVPPADGVEPLLSEVRYDYGQPRWYPISKGDMASLIDGTKHFIRGGDGAAELYDTEADPGEHRNLAVSSRWRDTAQRLAATLRAAVPVSKE